MALVGATSLFHSLGNNMICKSIRKRYCFALNLVIFCLQLYTFIKVMHLFGGTWGLFEIVNAPIRKVSLCCKNRHSIKGQANLHSDEVLFN